MMCVCTVFVFVCQHHSACVQVRGQASGAGTHNSCRFAQAGFFPTEPSLRIINRATLNVCVYYRYLHQYVSLWVYKESKTTSIYQDLITMNLTHSALPTLEFSIVPDIFGLFPPNSYTSDTNSKEKCSILVAVGKIPPNKVSLQYILLIQLVVTSLSMRRKCSWRPRRPFYMLSGHVSTVPYLTAFVPDASVPPLCRA